MIGNTLAHYEITRLLGKGGMGEVYRARDTKLDRDVAIKVLPPEFGNDPERVARFRREAKSLAALQHTNVASIYGFEDSADARFLVMEHVEGEDLSERLVRGALDLEEALEIARQMAVGLEAAHAQGIVHRDLKPANVKVTPSGDVKILDFGLARAFAGDSGNDPDHTHSPTITAAMTQGNVLLGTAAYMSPEQARGMAVDQRADIWAFGVILFEMLTGTRGFEGNTVSDKLASILKSEPDWERLPAKTPTRVRELLEKCLAKKRRARLHSIADARLEIEWVQAGRTGDTRPDTESRGGGWIRVLPVALAFLILGTIAGWWLGRSDTREPTGARRLSLQLPERLDVQGWLLAPDGTIAIRARPDDGSVGDDRITQVYLRAPDRAEFVPVEGTRGASRMAFSPDGVWLAILAPDPASITGLFLWKVRVDGSAPPLKVRPWPDEWQSNCHWLPGGDLVVLTRHNELVRLPGVSTETSAPIPVVAEDFEDQFLPLPSLGTVLPDGIHLMTSVESWSENGYQQDIAILNVETGQARLLLRNAGAPCWSETGHLFFTRGSTLLAVRMDPDRLEITSEPVAVANGLRVSNTWAHASFDLSASGDLIHLPGGVVGQKRKLVWADRNLEILAPWSPDERAYDGGYLTVGRRADQVAVAIPASTSLYETWAAGLDRPPLRRFAYEAGRDVTPLVFTLDSSALIYSSYSPVGDRIYLQPLEGGAERRLLFRNPTSRADANRVVYYPTDLADGGRTLLGTHIQAGKYSVVAHSMADTSTTLPDRVILENAGDAVMSPDERWVAYEVHIDGRIQVQVRRWLGDGRLGPEIRVSAETGLDPDWLGARDGEPVEIWFLSEGNIHAVPVLSMEDMTLGPERVVGEFDRFVRLVETEDGRILAILRADDEKNPRYLDVTIGWLDGIRDRLP